MLGQHPTLLVACTKDIEASGGQREGDRSRRDTRDPFPNDRQIIMVVVVGAAGAMITNKKSSRYFIFRCDGGLSFSFNDEGVARSICDDASCCRACAAALLFVLCVLLLQRPCFFFVALIVFSRLVQMFQSNLLDPVLDEVGWWKVG